MLLFILIKPSCLQMVKIEICNWNVYDDWNIGLRCPGKLSSLGGPTFKKNENFKSQYFMFPVHLCHLAAATMVNWPANQQNSWKSLAASDAISPTLTRSWTSWRFWRDVKRYSTIVLQKSRNWLTSSKKTWTHLTDRLDSFNRFAHRAIQWGSEYRTPEC